ncbi:MAG: hypothetical protein OHK0045_25380 [Raineya sp.]
MKELWNRLVAKTPKFWVKMQKLLLAVAFVAGVGLTQIEQLPKWDWLDDCFRMGIFAGLFGTFLAQLTKDNTSQDEHKTTTPGNNQPNNTI